MDVAELLVHDVLVPVAATDDPPDQVKEVAEVAMLLRMAHRLGDQPITARSGPSPRRLPRWPARRASAATLVGRVSAQRRSPWLTHA
ncbi:MAG: hypothetical protein IPO89_00005 [Actinomycetales bacterium]|nr:hypothetical protein [Candidatus Lutibacillus vidarii]